jgi:isopenicillin-N epimerase
MRDLFLLDPDVVFLNHGSYGACPREVLQAQHDWQLRMERNPVAFLGRQSAQLLLAAREALATEVGARSADLVFIPNSTTGVNIVARSLALGPGDEVLTTDLEYGACDATWLQVCAQAGAHYRRVEVALPFEPGRLVEQLAAAVTPRTRLIYLSHITSTTALTLPVGSVCTLARRLGIPTLVDGAHAPGQIELALDALGADFYVGNCHKWMCAPKGSAFLYARPQWQNGLQATVTSWGYAPDTGGHSGFDAYLGRTLFERRLQWQGTRDISPWLAVPAAIDFQRRHDWPAVRRRCHELALETLQAVTHRHGLAPIAGEAEWAQMVAIPVASQDPERLRRRLLEESGIEIPVTTHAGRVFVRLSVQGYNTREDLSRLLDAPALRA